jgi:hypothetical protein
MPDDHRQATTQVITVDDRFSTHRASLMKGRVTGLAIRERGGSCQNPDCAGGEQRFGVPELLLAENSC